MKVLSLAKSSLSAMMANKTRTSLTILGIVIGIASVIIVFSAGEGINGLVMGQIESFGTDIINTEIKVPTNKKGSNMSTEGSMDLVQGAQITTLNLDDMEDMLKIPNINNAYAGILSQEKVSQGSESKKALILGTNASYIEIDKSEIEEGRFFTEEEVNSLAHVAVLGYKMKEKLFGQNDPVGRMIKVRKNKFRVIGVMEERGAVMGMDFDDYVYLPIKTLQKKIMGIDHVMYIVSQVDNLDYAEETAVDIRYLLRDNHDIKVDNEDDFNKDDFRVTTMTEMMDMMDTITGALTLLLLAIVAISLVVGGVGIMNIMYVIVSERTSEIGLRKAVGAKYVDIMMQFLIESIIITMIGGIVGVIVGVLISFIIAIVANSYGFEWSFVISTKSIVTALFFSIFFGIAFGLYPARKAARMDPIEALRQE